MRVEAVRLDYLLLLCDHWLRGMELIDKQAWKPRFDMNALQPRIHSGKKKKAIAVDESV